MNEDEIKIERLESHIESLQSLVDALVSGLDIRSKINNELRQRIQKQDALFCPLLRDSCRKDRCVAYVKQGHVDTWEECKALDVILVSTKASEDVVE